MLTPALKGHTQTNCPVSSGAGKESMPAGLGASPHLGDGNACPWRPCPPASHEALPQGGAAANLSVCSRSQASVAESSTPSCRREGRAPRPTGLLSAPTRLLTDPTLADPAGSPGPGEVTSQQFTTFPSSWVHCHSSLGAETEVGERTPTPPAHSPQNKLQKHQLRVRAVRGGPPRALMKELSLWGVRPQRVRGRGQGC